MAKGTITKVMKYELRYLGGFSDFHEMQKEVWQLQRQYREILNKTIQIALHWDYVSAQQFGESGTYLDIREETGYKTLDGYIYNCLKGAYSEMASANLNAAVQKAWKKYKNSKTQVLQGVMSLPSYKSDQPILIDKGNVKLSAEENNGRAVLTLFSRNYRDTRGLKGNVEFSVLLHDGTQKSIFRNLIDKTYALGQCQLVYERKKWFLLLTYSFTPAGHALDPEKILGVDLGECYALYASSCYAPGILKIEGGEIAEYALRLEKRKRSLQQQARYCGEGRIGHGTKTRVGVVYKAEDRIASFRETINHRYSKELVDYAVSNGYGTIQMEDLSAIQKDLGFPKRLRHWTYYDLQMKITNKAKEHGIAVVKIDPRYTSQRCSKCGHIDPANRPRQEEFCCTACGYACNADYNASQNISIKGIEKIIQKMLSAKAD